LELSRDESFKQIQWKCGTVINEEEIWLCCEGFKEKVVSKICIIKSINDGFDVTSPICTIDSQVLCIKGLSNGTVLAGTLESMLYSISTLKKEQLWSMKLSDSILDILYYEMHMGRHGIPLIRL
jgi:hypothetical protein